MHVSPSNRSSKSAALRLLGAAQGEAVPAGPAGNQVTKWWRDGCEPLYYVVSPKVRARKEQSTLRTCYYAGSEQTWPPGQ
eukprot:scaffold32563_cov24-Prasinocladus_malaysianus.AAC.1